MCGRCHKGKELTRLAREVKIVNNTSKLLTTRQNIISIRKHTIIEVLHNYYMTIN